MKTERLRELTAFCLILLLVVSSFPVNASAYVDSSHIKYKEAVDVLSTLGVMGGYGDGSFDPNGSLSRGAAAKIICKIALGDDLDSKQNLNANVIFPDVPAENEFSQYVAFCAQNNYISGYSDGTFHTERKLTGKAFIKMLLCALGYNQDIEGYRSVDTWAENVMQRANATGITEGLSANFNVNADISREKAALLAFNTLQADMVEYPTNNSGEAFPRTQKGSKNIVQLFEQSFPSLVCENRKDVDQNPVARWKFNGKLIGDYPRGFKITFDPNGGVIKNVGSIQMSHILVKYNNLYQTLPTAEREDSRFSGWYTERVGGQRIKSDSRLTERSDQVLYAHWDEWYDDGGITEPVDALTYAFGNDADSFKYTAGYTIPLMRYQMVFGKETAIAKQLHKLNSEWHGNCYGMTSSVGIFHDGGSNVSDYNKEALRPSNLSPTDRNDVLKLSLVEFIEAMQISQFGDAFQSEDERNTGNLSGLVEAVKRFQAEQVDPIVICIYQENVDSQTNGYSGHAVLGYRVQEGRDGTHVYVYDPNFPGDQNRRITLYEGDKWYYNLNDNEDWGSDFYGRISFVSYTKYLKDFETWAKEGGQLTVGGSDHVFLTLDVSDAKITDSSGNEVARFQRGRKISGNRDVYQVTPLGVTRDGVRPESSSVIGVWLPANKEYTISVSAQEEYEASLASVQKGLSVTTVAKSMTLTVPNDEDASVTIYDGGCPYTVEFWDDNSSEDTRTVVGTTGPITGTYKIS